MIKNEAQNSQGDQHSNIKDEIGFRRIIRNFTPSWFIITMSTGALSIMLHQIPYHAHWLDIVSEMVFVLNILLFLLFTFISTLRYTMYSRLFPAVLRHPHQSLFLATFPVGLATLINMIVLACVRPWGQGMAIFAWVLWWIDSVLAVATSHNKHRLSNRRHDLEEMTALYLIPIVAIVIAATSGALVAGVLTNAKHQLWTLVISYIFWGIGTPLSWIIIIIIIIILPLQREVIVSLLLPIGPLGLSGFSLIALGKVARHSFPLSGTIPHVANTGDIFYLFGLIVGILLWGFAVVWFITAAIMIATAYPFPFNMGWWGFIFPILGVFTLLTISIGEEFEFKFFKVLSCVLTGICVVMWFIVAARTVKRAASGKMFFAPCLGTDLFLKRVE
ncbi:hypothetical protein COCC4DRAFT_147789 [Bipolaris maydis ATCC 48331]|uniref:C4-dicarboxylate transporter/malic acid transport protein n=2 Tax=Cochliobolus heterostrophus TaxID=5016 RepID=M2V3M2_COCH5|nr:uncharacterized protein COCC4DRAFT_147789 [Bipolaris maydis ATCC 48331]EMD94607.1 hypothetical protein COCHEDRAFT_1092818 [Bipolaris maydis C5]ENI01680.1 hypothetical protein COCC4DRAFT_147789 [Bipolaris maydis ATCC 48331]